MSMRVHNSDYFEELRQCALSASGSSPRRSQLGSSGRHSLEFSPMGSSGGGGLASLSPPHPSRSFASELSRETQMKRVAMKHELYLKEQETMQKKLTESIAENLQKQKTRKEAQYMKLWQEVENGKALAEELHEKLKLQEQSKTRQFQHMHDEWTTGVFNKLNAPVLRKVAAMDSKELSLSKHETYQRFLDITNKKGGLFRDIIIESEYNPLHDVHFVRHRAKIDDPVKRVIRRREEENAIAQEGSSLSRESRSEGSNSSSRRERDIVCRSDSLDVKLWSKGVFESTPYGYFHKMMASTASADGAHTYASRVKFDHYDIETGPEAVHKELPRGKRTDFTAHDVVVPKTTIQLQ